MKTILLLNTKLVNEGKIEEKDIFISEGKIEEIGNDLSNKKADTIIDAKGKYLMPGVIDDQVHFREPGFTHKADIYHEAKAAVAGGTTSFMEMPNTNPQSLTQELLEEKYQIASKNALANYSFYMGVSNDNLEEVLKTNPKNVCGVKVFMGSSTGNMLVDNPSTLEQLFAQAPILIATHCEDEATVKARLKTFEEKYGENATAEIHPQIRNEEACLISSTLAKELAVKHNTRLHILHLTTADELHLFDNSIPIAEKRITSEVCVHHLWFSADDYKELGNKIKCNPAIKAPKHRKALWEALLDNRLDVIATDHAPHTWEEKQQSYWKAPAGLPLVQYSLLMMLEHYKGGKISLERLVEKMAHAPAICFEVEKRGFIKEGFWADLVLVDLEGTTEVKPENIIYKAGWSPLNDFQFQSRIEATIVSGHLAYYQGKFDESKKGERLTFER